MGRLIPKNSPKYDHGLDLDLIVHASRAEIASAVMTGLHENIEVEEHTSERLLLSGKSLVKVKNIWMEVAFHDHPAGTQVTSRITKAHTTAVFYILGIGIGPSKVRGLVTYVTLTNLWRTNLGALAQPTP